MFGTSAFGNLYRRLTPDVKLEIARAWFRHVNPPVVLDTAGKYGAGLALETIGRVLAKLEVDSRDVIISNKLGWKQVPLRGPEPTFEPGVWKGLEHDAAQRISYDGIMNCWEQGNRLLQAYTPSLVSVHDPDEFLGHPGGDRMQDLTGAYAALTELKQEGLVRGVGVGAKDWRVIRLLSDYTDLDWVMPACSLTVYRHEPELVRFLDSLHERSIAVINSAVFNAGFLVGGDYFDYRLPDRSRDAALFAWRIRFLETCRAFDVAPADACVEFGLSHPSVAAVALNTSRPDRVAANVESTRRQAPAEFWAALKKHRIIDPAYPFV